MSTSNHLHHEALIMDTVSAAAAAVAVTATEALSPCAA